MQLQGDVSIFGRIVRRFFNTYLIEGELLGTLACDVLILGRGAIQIILRKIIHVVSGADAVEYVGLQHGVKYWTRNLNVVVRQNTHVIFHVLGNFHDLRIRQNRRY